MLVQGCEFRWTAQLDLLCVNDAAHTIHLTPNNEPCHKIAISTDLVFHWVRRNTLWKFFHYHPHSSSAFIIGNVTFYRFPNCSTYCSTYTRNPVVCLLDLIKYSLNCIANLFMANKIQSSTHPFSLNPSLIQPSKPITFNQHQCTSLKRFASLLAPLRKSGSPSYLIMELVQ